jgi:type IV pilus assembly protein PilV
MAAENLRRRRHRPAGQRGVALIEVMVGLLIFLIGVLGIIGLQAKAIQFTVQAEDRSRAALLANDLVVQMWTQRSTELPQMAVNDWKARVAASLPAASASVGSANGVATVKIEWKSPKAVKADAATNQYTTQVALP